MELTSEERELLLDIVDGGNGEGFLDSGIGRLVVLGLIGYGNLHEQGYRPTDAGRLVADLLRRDMTNEYAEQYQNGWNAGYRQNAIDVHFAVSKPPVVVSIPAELAEDYAIEGLGGDVTREVRRLVTEAIEAQP